MSTETRSYLDVRARAEEFQCQLSDTICFLPRNFDTAKSKEDLLHEGSAPTIRKLLVQEGIELNTLDSPGSRLPLIQEKGIDWIGPTIFLSAEILLNQPDLPSLVLTTVRDYLIAYFRGMGRHPTVRLSVVTERRRGKKKEYRKIKYEGDVEGLKILDSMIRGTGADE